MEAVLPTADLLVTSTDPTPGDTASYQVTVKGGQSGTGVVTSEMDSDLLAGTTIVHTRDPGPQGRAGQEQLGVLSHPGPGPAVTVGPGPGGSVTSPMGTLRFFFGTMGSGKSTTALQIHHNLARRGLHGLVCTQLDRVSGRLSSRLGVSVPAVAVDPDRPGGAGPPPPRCEGTIDYVVADEANFLTPAQVEQLAVVADELDADVYAFGLLTDFRGRLFPGTARLLELADERTEIQVEARCWCGARATQNARLVDGQQVYEGDVVVPGDTAGEDGAVGRVTYELLCRQHWQRGETGLARGATLRHPAAGGS